MHEGRYIWSFILFDDRTIVQFSFTNRTKLLRRGSDHNWLSSDHKEPGHGVGAARPLRATTADKPWLAVGVV
jgi:hypothetical protein